MPRILPSPLPLVATALTAWGASAALTPGPLGAQWTNLYPQAGPGHHVYIEGYELPTLTTGPMDPAVSPDGATVAVASEGWLWLVDVGTRVVTRFTDGPAMDSRPAWAPDGSEVVFLRDDGSNTWIAAKEVDAGAERVVVDADAIELDPSVGLDGSVWYSSGEAGRVEVWRLDPATGERTRYPTQGRVSRSAQASPDGRRLLIKEAVDRVVVRDLATDEDLVLHQGNIMSQMEPALSPDGRQVAYQVPQAQGDGWELRVASVDRPGTSVLLAGGGDRLPLAPAWSPDGAWIWFSEAGRDEGMRLFRVPAAGGAVEEVAIVAWLHARDRGRLLSVRFDEARAALEARVSAR